MKLLPILLAGALLAAAAPASAAVSTTCGSADTCTLSQLLGGGSITVDDVTFGSFNFNSGDDFGSISVDTSAVTVTGAGDATHAWIDFVFDPSLDIQGIDETVAYIFSYLTSVDGSSTRQIIGAQLLFMDSQLSIVGDATSEVLDALDGGIFLDIFADSLDGTQSSDSSAITATKSLSGETDLTLAGFEGGASAHLSGFRFLVTLDSELPSPTAVPLPTAAPFFMVGLGALGLFRRRRKRPA
ncbi:MAG TPA: VPLPA-CTERM sorting domain-containing protein [Parvularculaceae bacterium]|nr:VPLPA-CTERM sorting domain-containing protein [Parvularculaceae bacterium]